MTKKEKRRVGHLNILVNSSADSDEKLLYSGGLHLFLSGTSNLLSRNTKFWRRTSKDGHVLHRSAAVLDMNSASRWFFKRQQAVGPSPLHGEFGRWTDNSFKGFNGEDCHRKVKFGKKYFQSQQLDHIYHPAS